MSLSEWLSTGVAGASLLAPLIVGALADRLRVGVTLAEIKSDVANLRGRVDTTENTNREIGAKLNDLVGKVGVLTERIENLIHTIERERQR